MLTGKVRILFRPIMANSVLCKLQKVSFSLAAVLMKMKLTLSVFKESVQRKLAVLPLLRSLYVPLKHIVSIL